jgi:hypothetical protein
MFPIKFHGHLIEVYVDGIIVMIIIKKYVEILRTVEMISMIIALSGETHQGRL